MLSIRQVQPKDLEQLLLLCAEHAAYEKQAYDPTGKLESLQQAIFGQIPRLFVWVVVNEQHLLGFAAVTLDFSTWDAAQFAHLDCLYLQEAARAKGIGAAIFKTVLEFASSRGCINLQWQTPEWNTLAIRFYERQGATAKTKKRFKHPVLS